MTQWCTAKRMNQLFYNSATVEKYIKICTIKRNCGEVDC